MKRILIIVTSLVYMSLLMGCPAGPEGPGNSNGSSSYSSSVPYVQPSTPTNGVYICYGMGSPAFFDAEAYFYTNGITVQLQSGFSDTSHGRTVLCTEMFYDSSTNFYFIGFMYDGTSYVNAYCAPYPFNNQFVVGTYTTSSYTQAGLTYNDYTIVSTVTSIGYFKTGCTTNWIYTNSSFTAASNLYPIGIVVE